MAAVMVDKLPIKVAAEGFGNPFRMHIKKLSQKYWVNTVFFTRDQEMKNGHFSPQYSYKTHHSRARYGIFFCEF